ncbi:MAG TPA: glucuronate isomerase [Steroidobacteraceae bacterium]|nr:glucuronate isomerase [Steroidobacteraceae bacterium]
MKLELHPDRLFPAEPGTRAVARELYAQVARLPILSPHGHTDPAWFATNAFFENPAQLLIVPDHYVLRMLYSQGVPLEALGIARIDGGPSEADPRKIWRCFAEHYYLFRGTPSRLWLDWVFAEVFGLDRIPDARNADAQFDQMQAALRSEAFRPRALFERFGIEVLATTEGALDSLANHHLIRSSGWRGRVISTYRPDAVVDPQGEDFVHNLQRFGELTGEDISSWEGYLRAHQCRRAYFRAAGATATDHGHPSATTADLSPPEARALYARILSGRYGASDADVFRGQVLTEMARMSLEDGMVLQLHPGVHRSHNVPLLRRFGRDKGGDIPLATEYVRALQPLLNLYGTDPRLTFIVFTLDEDAYSRELAPLAGHYPALRLGPPWWFHDSPEGMRRFRERVTETAGFYNTVGFNDDTRAFLSIPARHDVARRMDCGFLARLVAEHRLGESEAQELAQALSYGLAKAAYRL